MKGTAVDQFQKKPMLPYHDRFWFPLHFVAEAEHEGHRFLIRLPAYWGIFFCVMESRSIVMSL